MRADQCLIHLKRLGGDGQTLTEAITPPQLFIRIAYQIQGCDTRLADLAFVIVQGSLHIQGKVIHWFLLKIQVTAEYTATAAQLNGTTQIKKAIFHQVYGAAVSIQVEESRAPLTQLVH